MKTQATSLVLMGNTEHHSCPYIKHLETPGQRIQACVVKAHGQSAPYQLVPGAAHSANPLGASPLPHAVLRTSGTYCIIPHHALWAKFRIDRHFSATV